MISSLGDFHAIGIYDFVRFVAQCDRKLFALLCSPSRVGVRCMSVWSVSMWLKQMLGVYRLPCTHGPRHGHTDMIWNKNENWFRFSTDDGDSPAKIHFYRGKKRYRWYAMKMQYLYIISACACVCLPIIISSNWYVLFFFVCIIQFYPFSDRLLRLLVFSLRTIPSSDMAMQRHCTILLLFSLLQLLGLLLEIHCRFSTNFNQ